jgi:hypothetical protein
MTPQPRPPPHYLAALISRHPDDEGSLAIYGKDERERAMSLTGSTSAMLASGEIVTESERIKRLTHVFERRKALMEQLCASKADVCCVHIGKNGHLPLHFAGLEKR